MPTNQQQVHTKIDIATSTDVVASVTGQRIYVMSGFLVAAGTVTLVVKDGSTALTGAMSMAAGVPFDLEPIPDGTPIFTTSAGAVLNLTLGSGVQLSGWLKIVQA